MAIYVSAGRRLRRTIVIAAVAAVVAFGLGWLFGRQQVPSVDDRVAESRAAAQNIATGLDRLDIEYEQVLTGTDGETVERGVLEPIDALRADLQRAMDRAPWITGPQRSAALDAMLATRAVAADGASLDDFRSSAATASALVRDTFGVTDTVTTQPAPGTTQSTS